MEKEPSPVVIRIPPMTSSLLARGDRSLRGSDVQNNQLHRSEMQRTAARARSCGHAGSRPESRSVGLAANVTQIAASCLAWAHAACPGPCLEIQPDRRSNRTRSNSSFPYTRLASVDSYRRMSRVQNRLFPCSHIIILLIVCRLDLQFR